MFEIVDLHCDTIMALYQNKELKLKSNNLQIDINKMKNGNYLAQVFAMFVYLKKADNPFKVCDEMIDIFYNELEENKDEIKIALNYDDIIKNELKVMDTSACALCKQNRIPIVVFDFKKEDGIKNILNGQEIGTYIS